MNALLDQFLIEARENLAFIEQNLENLGSADKELINAIFRAAHTLKGGSGIVGFESVKNITHKAEDLLDGLRSGKFAFAEGMIEALYDAFDEVVDLVEAAEQSGDVVGIDEERLAKVVTGLNSVMGISDKKENESVWSSPFVLSEELFFRDEMIFEGFTFPQSLPFDMPIIDQEFVASKNSYAVLFDVSEDCMVFGNDPLYALSLLECGARGINIFIDNDTSKAILSGFDDEEGKKLRIIFTAFVYADFSMLEESLYNFLDELVFFPLSITSLLTFEKGKFENVAFIKDFCYSAVEAILSSNRSALESAISEALGLLSSSSAEFAMLKRLREILPFTADSDITKLQGYITCIREGRFYTKEAFSQCTSEITAVSVEEKVIDPKEVAAAKTVLRQQQMQLKAMPIEPVIMRVKTMCKQVSAWLGTTFNDSLTDAESILAWINEMLDETPVSKPMETPQEVVVPVPVISTPKVVITPLEEVKSEPVVAVSAVDVMVTPPVVISSVPSSTSKVVQSDEPKAEVKKGDVIGKIIKVEQEIVDHLMSLAGELLIEKNSLPYLADAVRSMETEETRRAILEKYFSIGRLSNRLQDLIMSMRMLPISYVFDRYPKLVRDISKNLGKKVKLEQEGGDTKLDKNMIEMLADPLIHIMRNSLDHGIEMPEDRRANGKNDTGLVRMKAYPQSDKVILEIIDDGKGIDPDRVASKVLEKGLMSLEKIEEMSEQEKVELIMLPGLSTAETISEYSGRGVGMDVVKKSIESFGGSVSIQSKLGEGTKLTLSIPVSLAVTNLLHVYMNGYNYGFPMDSVSETVKLEREHIATIYNRPVISIRGQVIPLLYLPDMLDVVGLENQSLPIVILNVKGNQLAVVVNELLGQLDVVQKPLEGVLADHPMLSGTSLLGNGQIIMIIDPIKLYGLKDQLGSNGVV